MQVYGVQRPDSIGFEGNLRRSNAYSFAEKNEADGQEETGIF